MPATYPPAPAPAHWADTDAQPWRGCLVCDHGTGPADHRLCSSPDVAGRHRSVPVEQARSRGGACGPEAEHLDFPGLRPVHWINRSH